MRKAIPKVRMFPLPVSLDTVVPRAIAAFDTYGDVFKLVLPLPFNIYCLRKPDHIKALSMHKAYGTTKPPGTIPKSDFFMGNGLVNDLGGASWKAKRDVVMPVFTMANARLLTESLPDCIDRMATRWAVDDATPVELYHELERMVLDFGARALFSRTFSDERLDWVVSATHFADEMFTTLTPYWIPTPSNLRFQRLRREYHALVQGLIDDRRASGEPAPDLLDALIHTEHPETGRPHTDEEMRDQIFSAYFGTAALTQTLLVGLFFLSTHPEMLEKLRSELAEVVGNRLPLESDLRHLPYLQMLVQEVLRAYPSFWGSLRYAEEPIELGEYAFPAKSIFVMMRSAAQRHPDHWDRSTELIPERHAARNACPHAWLPFGLGPRTCAGKSLALVFCPLAIASIAQRFDIRFESADLPLKYGFGITPAKPMMATVEARRDAALAKRCA